MPEHSISSHMGIQMVQDTPLAHAWLHNQVTHDHWIHAWEPDHFMHDHTVHLRWALYSCMNTWWSHKCCTGHMWQASASRGYSRASVGGGHELPCAVGSWLWSWCNFSPHPKMPGPQRSPQCSITEILKKEQPAQGEETWGDGRGDTWREI